MGELTRTVPISDAQFEHFQISNRDTLSDMILWMMKSIMPKVFKDGIFGEYFPVQDLERAVQWILNYARVNNWDMVRHAGTKHGSLFTSIRHQLEEGFEEWALENKFLSNYDLSDPIDRIAYRRLTFFKFMVMHAPLICIAHAQRVMESRVDDAGMDIYDIDWRTSKILAKGWNIARTQADVFIFHSIPTSSQQYLAAIEESAYERTAWERNVIKAYETRSTNTKRFEKPSKSKKDYVDSPSDSVMTTDGVEPGNRRKRLPDLAFPDKIPPPGKTHYSGYYRPNDKGQPIWVDYFQRVNEDNCPINVSYNLSHWAGRVDPDGFSYGDDGRVRQPSLKTSSARFQQHVEDGQRLRDLKPKPKPGSWYIQTNWKD